MARIFAAPIISTPPPLGIPEGLKLYKLDGAEQSIGIQPGRVVFDLGGGARQSVHLAADLIKRINGPWGAAVTGGRGVNSPYVSNGRYLVYLLWAPATGDIDAILSNDISSDLPIGWVARRIGGFVLDGSGFIVPFLQNGSWFEYLSGLVVTNSANFTGGTYPTQRVGCIIPVPPTHCKALMTYYHGAAANGDPIQSNMLIGHYDHTSEAAFSDSRRGDSNGTTGPVIPERGSILHPLDSLGRVVFRASSPGIIFSCSVHGFDFPLGESL